MGERLGEHGRSRAVRETKREREGPKTSLPKMERNHRKEPEEELRWSRERALGERRRYSERKRRREI